MPTQPLQKKMSLAEVIITTAVVISVLTIAYVFNRILEVRSADASLGQEVSRIVAPGSTNQYDTIIAIIRLPANIPTAPNGAPLVRENAEILEFLEALPAKDEFVLVMWCLSETIIHERTDELCPMRQSWQYPDKER